jgi:hypothetical protein
MLTLRELCPAFAPESLERSPTLPTAHRQGISASQQCQRGAYGHRLSQCQPCAGQHRVQHAWGNRHCPQCQQPTTPQWLQPHVAQQLPGPPWLLTFTVPAALRPLSRSPQRLASQALLPASSMALTQLAKDPRFLGTTRLGCTGVLPTWGRQRQSPPHIHDMVPGGGLAPDRPAWHPSRANCLGPVQALSPISRALCKENMRQAGLLEPSAPQVWTIPWNVHRQAKHHRPSACTSLAPSVCKVALSPHRLVSLTDRPGTFTSRPVGSARLRTAQLDVMEFLRRFLQPGLPHGFVTIRHFGLLHARGALPLATIRLMLMLGHPMGGPPTSPKPPQPRAARCPTCGAPMRRVMRVWPSPRAFVDTGGVAEGCPDACEATRCATPMAPVRPHAGIRRHKTAAGGKRTHLPASHRRLSRLL